MSSHLRPITGAHYLARSCPVSKLLIRPIIQGCSPNPRRHSFHLESTPAGNAFHGPRSAGTREAISAPTHKQQVSCPFMVLDRLSFHLILIFVPVWGSQITFKHTYHTLQFSPAIVKFSTPLSIISPALTKLTRILPSKTSPPVLSIPRPL